MAPSSKPTGGSRQQAQPRPRGQQQQQKIPRKNLLGPGGDPAEGKREIGPKVKRSPPSRG